MRALRNWAPNILLIEGTEEGEELLAMVTQLGMVPPVAMLVYDVKNSNKAAYYPFAEFSPEWNAIKYGLDQGLPIRLIDLPISMQWHESYKQKLSDASQTEGQKYGLDPLSQIAKEAGFESGERWWESLVEQRRESEDIFAHVSELIGLLRKDSETSASNLLREAYMRKRIRATIKEGYERIAVICGAYHAPALEQMPAVKSDNNLLKGLRKTKVHATWIPWTYERLSYTSGYGAGVLSPAWYELMYNLDRDELVLHWMSRTAALLRDEGIDASPASVIEAVRLTEMLSTIRALEVPGLEEMQEAVKSVFNLRDDSLLNLIHRQLIIGDKMGTVPDSIPLLPLQAEINKLGKKWKKAGPLNKQKDQEKFDLRKERDLAFSQFFHRLNLLNIHWGRLTTIGGAKGSFWEAWKIRWNPEIELEIIEAATWGNTLETACLAFVNERLNTARDDISELARLLEKAFLANLPALLLKIVNRLSDQVATQGPVAELMQAVLPLVNVMRYGNVRQTEASLVKNVIDAALPRIFIGLAPACKQIDDELADQMFEKIIGVNNAVQLLNLQEFTSGWNQTLLNLIHKEGVSVHRKLAGVVSRMLQERKLISEEELSRFMNLELASHTDPARSAKWLEGLLYGSGLLLIHNPSMIRMISEWLKDLNEDTFLQVLPLLRRSFSEYAKPERAAIARVANAKHVQLKEEMRKQVNEDNLKRVIPVLRLLLDGA